MLEHRLGQVELLLVRQAAQRTGHREAVFVAFVIGHEIFGEHVAQQRHTQHVARQLRQALAVDEGVGIGQVELDLAGVQRARAAKRVPDNLHHRRAGNDQGDRTSGDLLACELHGGIVGKTGGAGDLLESAPLEGAQIVKSAGL